MPVTPQQPRYSIEKLENNLRITIPAKKRISFFIAVAFSLVIFTCLGNLLFVGWKAIDDAIRVLSNFPEVTRNTSLITFAMFLIIFLVIIVLPVGLIVYRVLWILTGREVVFVSSKITTISYRMTLRNKVKEYWSDKIVDLRVNEQALIWGSGNKVKFDYGSRTFTFGEELTEAEARQIIFIMKKHLQQNTD